MQKMAFFKNNKSSVTKLRQRLGKCVQAFDVQNFRYLMNSIVVFEVNFKLGTSTFSLTKLKKNNDTHHNDTRHNGLNRAEHIRHQFRKTTGLSCHGCLINIGVEKMNNI